MTEHAIPGYEHAAKCRDEDPEMWFPVPAKEPEGSPAQEARALCRKCPVRMACAQTAVDQGRQYGIWAGFRLEYDRPQLDEAADLLAFAESAPVLVGVA